MEMKRYLLFFLLILTASFTFIGGDCGTENDPEVIIGAPQGVELSLGQNPGGGSYAIVSWDASTSENDADFNGYRIKTYVVSDSGTVISVYGNELVARTPHTKNFGITPGIKYITYVLAELKSGKVSDSTKSATPIYGGVYSNSGVIDEYMTSGPAQSGFGWDPNTGAGTQYSFTSANLDTIDLHMRRDGSQLKFYSPNMQDNTGKTTLLALVGTGDEAYRNTNLNEPSLTSIDVSEGSVYLLKLASRNYVKVWVKEVNTIAGTPEYNQVEFEFKLQPIEGMRVLKR